MELPTSKGSHQYSLQGAASSSTEPAMSQSPAQPGSYGATPTGSWTQSPTQPGSYGATPTGSWTQSPTQPGSYGATPVRRWTQSPTQPGSYGTAPTGSWTQSPTQPGSYGTAPTGSWAQSPTQPGSYTAAPTVMSPQGTYPPRSSQMPHSSMQTGYFNEAPAMKVLQTMKDLPRVLRNVPPDVQAQEDDNNFPTSSNYKTTVSHAPLSDTEQEHLSSHSIGTAAIKGQWPSSLPPQEALRNLPEHLQKEVLLHLAKSIKVPAVEEVVQCNAEEKHLKSSELDSHVEMGKDSTSDSDVELENQPADSSNKTVQAMEKKGRQVDKNMTQSEKENMQSDYKIDTEPDKGTDRDGHETGDVNGNTTYREGDRSRNMAVGGEVIQDHSKQDKMMSEKGQQEQHELSKALAKDHSEPSMPPDKDHSEPSMPPDKNHSEPSMPPDKDHSEPSMPPDKDHSEPSMPHSQQVSVLKQ